MHKCYPQCKPEIGYHYHSGTRQTPTEHLKSHIKKLENSLEKARDVAGLAPNPDNYEVKDVKEYGKYKVLTVHYPNCTNFGGDKIIVTKCEMIDLVRLKRLDPHFTKTTPKDSIPIIARFPPSKEGIEMANDLAYALQENRLKKKYPEVKRSQTRDDW